MNEAEIVEILELGGELDRFKQGKLYARLRTMQQASYTKALNQLTRAALESTDLKVRGLALDVLKATTIWDELDTIESQAREIAAEANQPANEPRPEYQYDTP